MTKRQPASELQYMLDTLAALQRKVYELILMETERESAAPPPLPPKAVTVKEAAEMVRWSEGSLWKEIKAGRLQTVRLGENSVRIRVVDLEAWIEARRLATVVSS